MRKRVDLKWIQQGISSGRLRSRWVKLVLMQSLRCLP